MLSAKDSGNSRRMIPGDRGGEERAHIDTPFDTYRQTCHLTLTVLVRWSLFSIPFLSKNDKEK